MPSPPFPPRPAPKDDPYSARRTHETARTPRGILRPFPAPHDRPTPHPPISRGATSPYNHLHTSSSPELRPRADNAWAPRARPHTQQPPPDLAQTQHTSSAASSSHFVSRPRPDQDDSPHKRGGFAARVHSHFVPGLRSRAASDVRIAHTPPPDLEPDRLARACGQHPGSYRHDDRSRQTLPYDPSSRLRDSATTPSTDAASHPPVPKPRVSHMYRRLDALTRRSGRRAMDYISFEEVAIIHKRESHLREQLRRKRSERLQDRDPKFHAIGAPLEDVLLYASTAIVIGEYQHYLPVVVVACVEELTKTGIYQSGLFRALPSRDRHLQLIDWFDNGPDFGAQLNMRGQAMPDICALLSTFISSLASPLLDPPTYSALWHWSVKPSVKREDARRDQQEEEEEDRRARGEPPQHNLWVAVRNDLYPDDADIGLETDQLSIAQILLRLLPSANLSLLVYLCAFFTQLPLCPENGLQLEDVARIFGHRLLGGSAKVVSQRMMMWLLTRWHRISDNLFGDLCGMTPPPSPEAHRPGAGTAGEAQHERVEKRKGKQARGSDDALRLVPSSSSSNSPPPTESPEDQGVSSRKSSSDLEEEAESSEGSRRRKKRELDVQTPRSNVSRRSSTRKEARHGHGHHRRASRHHHHHGHAPEHTHGQPSPDPFAIAFAQAQPELVDTPVRSVPSSPDMGVPYQGHAMDARGFDASARVETPAHVVRTRRPVADLDVDKLIEETTVATDAARALAERVEVLERALGMDQGPVAHPAVRRHGEDPDAAHGGGNGNGHTAMDHDARHGHNHGKHVEGELRLQLRRVEAERDKAQRIVRDMKAFLMDDA